LTRTIDKDLINISYLLSGR
jgi:hypothetical protein